MAHLGLTQLVIECDTLYFYAGGRSISATAPLNARFPHSGCREDSSVCAPHRNIIKKFYLYCDTHDSDTSSSPLTISIRSWHSSSQQLFHSTKFTVKILESNSNILWYLPSCASHIQHGGNWSLSQFWTFPPHHPSHKFPLTSYSTNYKNLKIQGRAAKFHPVCIEHEVEIIKEGFPQEECFEEQISWRYSSCIHHRALPPHAQWRAAKGERDKDGFFWRGHHCHSRS